MPNTVADKTVKELHEMVQESKRLLMSWQRTSKLNKAEMKNLRKSTRLYLGYSSTAIVKHYVEETND